MSMRRADRKSGSDDNALNRPRSHKLEPLSYHELKQQLLTVRSQRDEWQEVAKEKEQQAKQTHQLYLGEQQKYQSTLTIYQEGQQKYQTVLAQYQEVKTQAQSYLVQYEEAQSQAKSYFSLYEDAQTQTKSYIALYEDAQTQTKSYLTLYETEKLRGDELSVKFEEIQTQCDRYLTLYNESQEQLKFERRSKAGIKGWETRRKRENQQLKQEISEMTILLRDSFNRKDEAVSNLYVLAERMDRIQQLVDSVDDSPTNPVGILQKFQRVWQAVKEILAE